MEIKAIRTEADYLAVLREVSALIDLDPADDEPEGERLDVLGTLVQAFEAKHYPIDPPEPIEAIKFRMEQSGMTVKDLVSYICPQDPGDSSDGAAGGGLRWCQKQVADRK